MFSEDPSSGRNGTSTKHPAEYFPDGIANKVPKGQSYEDVAKVFRILQQSGFSAEQVASKLLDVPPMTSPSGEQTIFLLYSGIS